MATASETLFHINSSDLFSRIVRTGRLMHSALKLLDSIERSNRNRSLRNTPSPAMDESGGAPGRLCTAVMMSTGIISFDLDRRSMGTTFVGYNQDGARMKSPNSDVCIGGRYTVHLISVLTE
jgi:hypothetical protein